MSLSDERHREVTHRRTSVHDERDLGVAAVRQSACMMAVAFGSKNGSS
jgi:hypothetical protein